MVEVAMPQTSFEAESQVQSVLGTLLTFLCMPTVGGGRAEGNTVQRRSLTRERSLFKILVCVKQRLHQFQHPAQAPTDLPWPPVQHPSSVD